MTLKVKFNDLHFQYQLRVSQDACLVQIIPGCMFGANLVIPAQICDELLRGQGKVYGRMDGQTQATTIPLCPERSRGKNESLYSTDWQG